MYSKNVFEYHTFLHHSQTQILTAPLINAFEYHTFLHHSQTNGYKFALSHLFFSEDLQTLLRVYIFCHSLQKTCLLIIQTIELACPSGIRSIIKINRLFSQKCECTFPLFCYLDFISFCFRNLEVHEICHL